MPHGHFKDGTGHISDLSFSGNRGSAPPVTGKGMLTGLYLQVPAGKVSKRAALPLRDAGAGSLGVKMH